MRLVFLSDTHLRHADIEVPDGDVVIHTGDFTTRGSRDECRWFLDWYVRLPHRHKVVIAGNHDFLAERDPAAFRALVPPGVSYLEDEEIELDGLRIWGSPVTPWFHDWAFNRQRGEEIARHWAKIPERVDVIAVHGPPRDVLDLTVHGDRVGCADLATRIAEVKPRIVAFGHIHEDAGVVERAGVVYVNSCVLDVRYRIANRPVVIDWPIAASDASGPGGG